MALTIRSAAPADRAAMVDLLLHDAGQRQALEPAIWPLAADARASVETMLTKALDGPPSPSRGLWLVAEASGRLAGLAHAMIVPVPPIYDPGVTPGLLLDDCAVAPDAPSETAAALLAAAEAALREAGATSFIASCPVAGPWHPLYEQAGYEPVTLYMAKHGFAAAAPPDVRAATPDDVPAIVRLSADHRRTLARLNPRFWHIHPEADGRFEQWMRYSLTLADRAMLVAGAPGKVRGYVIAQPATALLIPAVHAIAGIGVIDDFYAEDFAAPDATTADGTAAARLLAAAEAAFAQQGRDAALVVCPAAWTSKRALLEHAGYGTAKLWMLKR